MNNGLAEPGPERDEMGAEDMFVDVRHLSPDQLQQLGVSELAYVKKVWLNGGAAYAIHAADGSPMAVAGDFDLAIAAIHQQDMAATLVN